MPPRAPPAARAAAGGARDDTGPRRAPRPLRRSAGGAARARRARSSRRARRSSRSRATAGSSSKRHSRRGWPPPFIPGLEVTARVDGQPGPRERDHPLPVSGRGPGHAPVPGQGGPAAVARPALRPLRPPRAAGRGISRGAAARGAGEAVFSRGGLTGVFVVKEGTARLRWVAVGGPAAGLVPRSGPGLEAGERVATDPVRPRGRHAGGGARADARRPRPGESPTRSWTASSRRSSSRPPWAWGRSRSWPHPREEEPQIRVPMVDVTIAWPGAEPARGRVADRDPGRAGHVGASPAWSTSTPPRARASPSSPCASA